jgi:predicted extracellular nuclease
MQRGTVAWLLVGAAILLTALAPAMIGPAAAQDCATGPCIRIGTYNIKYFANNGPANTRREIGELVWRIANAGQANLDVVVLQEINKDGNDWKGPNGLRAKLRNAGYRVAIEGAFGGDSPSRPQFVVILYRTDSVSLVDGSAVNLDLPTAYDVGGKCEYKSLRPPVTAALKARTGNFPFRIIGVHLKSQLTVGTEATCDDDIRRFQAENILAYVKKLKEQSGEANIDLAGDFNARFAADEYGVLRSEGYDTLIAGDCSAAKLGQCSYVDPDRPSLIDHIVVHSALQHAVKGSGTIGKFGNLSRYLRKQSDHVPVWASFRTDVK